MSPQCSGPLARLRDEFGADSPVAIDNTVSMLFAGFDTTSSSLTYMLWLLAQHPEVLAQVSSAGHSWLGCTPRVFLGLNVQTAWFLLGLQAAPYRICRTRSQGHNISLKQVACSAA